MADNFSIGNILITTAIVIIAMTIGKPLITIFANNQSGTINSTIGTTYNASCNCMVYGAATVANSIVQGIYNPLNRSAMGTNGTNGNFAVSASQLSGLGGLAFYYVGIGQFFSQITTLGTALPNILLTLVALIPGVTQALAFNVVLIVSFITVIISLRFIIVGIISFTKVDIWSI